MDDLNTDRHLLRGKDGKYYSTLQELDAANAAYDKMHDPEDDLKDDLNTDRHLLRGKDGNYYSTLQELDAANAAYDKMHNPETEDPRDHLDR